MVRTVIRRLVDMQLWKQVLGVSVIAAAALFYLKGPEGAFIDLWLTPDQQGMRLYKEKEYEQAAERFDDPSWKAAAQFAAGDYAEAAGTWGRVPDAAGFYNRGNALMKAFEFRPAIAAYELAVAESPDWAEARKNLELAVYTLEYIEGAREQSNTGKEGGVGADDIVYDNESNRGVETRVSRESVVQGQSADKWMRSVDTDTADFLRSRFLLESARRGDM